MSVYASTPAFAENAVIPSTASSSSEVCGPDFRGNAREDGYPTILHRSDAHRDAGPHTAGSPADPGTEAPGPAAGANPASITRRSIIYRCRPR